MMPKRRSVRLYNVILPLWLLILFPQVWLVVLPANFLIDSLVVYFGLRRLKADDPNTLYKRSILKVYVRGFAADFVGVAALLGVAALCMLDDVYGWSAAIGLGEWVSEFSRWLTLDPFRNPAALLVTLAAVALAGWFIYQWDRRVFAGLGLAEEQAHRMALWLAVLTAPWLYLVPATLFY